MASNALAYGTLVLYALILASLLEKLAAVRDATVLAYRRAYYTVQDRGRDVEECPTPTAY